MATDVDIYVGKRLRRRRRLLGLTQQDLAGQVGVRFQQIQKYECGANRITASRLFSLATALNVNINYFFEGLAADGKQAPAKRRWNWSAPTTASASVRAAASSTWRKLSRATPRKWPPRKVDQPLRSLDPDRNHSGPGVSCAEEAPACGSRALKAKVPPWTLPSSSCPRPS